MEPKRKALIRYKNSEYIPQTNQVLIVNDTTVEEPQNPVYKRGKLEFGVDENERLIRNILGSEEGDAVVQLCITNQVNLSKTLRDNAGGENEERSSGGLMQSKRELSKKYAVQLHQLKDNGFRRIQDNLLALMLCQGNFITALRELMKTTVEREYFLIAFNNQLRTFSCKQERMSMCGYLQQTNGNLQKAIELKQITQKTFEDEALRRLCQAGWVTPTTIKKVSKIIRECGGDLSKRRDIDRKVQLTCGHKLKMLTAKERDSLELVKFETTAQWNRDKTSTLNHSSILNEDHSIQLLMVDANNLLYVHPAIRADCITRNRKNAETKLIDLCREFSQQKAVKQTLIIFDQMHLKKADGRGVGSTPGLSNSFEVVNIGKEIGVKSASSDDYIVQKIREQSNLEQSLIITSDRELTLRIIEISPKQKVMKGRVFFDILEATLSKEVFATIVKADQFRNHRRNDQKVTVMKKNQYF